MPYPAKSCLGPCTLQQAVKVRRHRRGGVNLPRSDPMPWFWKSGIAGLLRGVPRIILVCAPSVATADWYYLLRGHRCRPIYLGDQSPCQGTHGFARNPRSAGPGSQRDKITVVYSEGSEEEPLIHRVPAIQVTTKKYPAKNSN